MKNQQVIIGLILAVIAILVVVNVTADQRKEKEYSEWQKEQKLQEHEEFLLNLETQEQTDARHTRELVKIQLEELKARRK